MFSKMATKIGEIFAVDLTVCSKCQIDGEDFVNFCGLLKKPELSVENSNLNSKSYFALNSQYFPESKLSNYVARKKG